MTNKRTDDYVELKVGCDEVYDLAWAGTRGWITARQTDEYGFDKVYIEWDTEHWRYDGEPDGWTYATHFKPVESVEPPVEEIEIEVPKGPELVGPDQAPNAVDSIMRGYLWEDDRMEGYIDALSNSYERASESDGFILLTMKIAHDPEMGPVVVYEMSRGSALPALTEIPASAILAFISTQMRQKGY